MPTDLPPRRQPEPPPPAPSETPWRGVQGAILIISLLALLVLFLLPFFGDRPGRGRPWRVAITEPQILKDEGLSDSQRLLLVETIKQTCERMLSDRTGVLALPFDEKASDENAGPALDESAQPEQTLAQSDRAESDRETSDRSSQDRSLAGRAKDAGFDEMVHILIECEADRCRTLLRRLRTVDASPEWRRSFSFNPLDVLDIDDEVASELHVAFLKFSRRPGGPRLLAQAETYETFLQTRLDHRRGLVPTRRAIATVEALRADAPRSSDFHLYEADLRRQSGQLEAAADLLADAHRIAPGDVRPLMQLMPLLIELRRHEEALERLGQLEILVPGESRLETWREYVAK